MIYTIRQPVIFLLSAAILAIVGCADSDNNSIPNQGNTEPDYMLNLELPNSITGGNNPVVTSAPIAASIVQAVSTNTGAPCTFLGVEDDEPFRNGYQMTKFMVSAVAVWTCITDRLIELSTSIDQSGEIVATENDTLDPDYDAEDPTHYSVTDDSDTQTTIRLYYGYDFAIPPLNTDDPQLFVSWNEVESGDVTGRLIIDGLAINPADRKIDDPTMMRMDFSVTDSEKLVDMYLQFDNGNEWAEGFRIQVSKNSQASPVEQTYLARGLIEMKRQFVAVPTIDEIPDFRMYSVSDAFGEGAAVAEFVDVGVDLPLGLIFTDENLGSYLFTKTDNYYFRADGDWDYIFKNITVAEYKGGNDTSEATNAAIQTYFDDLGLLAGGELVACLGSIGDDQNCVDLLNAIFQDGFAEQEPNQGSDPADWRSVSLAVPNYINSIYPNGVDWSGAFDWSFTP